MVVVDLNFDDVLHRVENNGYCESFARLYGVDAETIARQNRRYAAALREFQGFSPAGGTLGYLCAWQNGDRREPH